jgi:RNA polymerase sigma-70 factor (ECF subfamily)
MPDSARRAPNVTSEPAPRTDQANEPVPISPLTVAAWAEHAKTGDRDAFAALYHARLRPVTRYVAALIRDTDRVDDVVAQTFLVAWRDLPKLRECARFDAWLFRIAHNQAFTEMRRRRYTADIDAAQGVAATDLETLPQDRLDWQLTVDELRSSMGTLPDEQRTVIYLRFFADLPHRDIARQLGKTEQAIRALQHRALARLRRHLQSAPQE